jgi:hypothetical protein
MPYNLYMLQHNISLQGTSEAIDNHNSITTHRLQSRVAFIPMSVDILINKLFKIR